MSDDMFSRWAKRREAVAREDQDDAPEAVADEAELEANRLAAEAVDIETLGPQSDLGVFLRNGVPEALKARALRAVWRSDPVFANLDGMVDYGEDFGRKELIMKTFTSAWQAGRGYLDKVIEETEEGDIAEDAKPVAAPAASEPPPAAQPVEDAPGIVMAEDTPEDDTPPPKVSLRSRMGV